MVGGLTAGPVADHWGRRIALISAALLSVIGGALTAGSVHVAMLIIVRVLQGAGLGALATLTPIYLAEASTPSKRGMLTGLHGFFMVSGYNISAWVGYGASYSTNLTFGWRGPLAFTCVPALVLLIGCIWVPESPRWLLMKGRNDQAWTILSRLHSDASDPDQLATNEEFYQMRKQIELERTNPGGYWTILTTPSYAKRAFLSCFVQYAANASGGLVINYYSVIIYGNLGMTGHMPLLLYAFYTLVGAIGNLGSLLTLDWTGRRFVRHLPAIGSRFVDVSLTLLNQALLTGFIGCLVALIIETAMIAEFVVKDSAASVAGQKAAIFAIFLFVFAYGFFIDAASFVYSSEIYPTNIRSRGVALSTATYFTACITFVTPGATAIANISWRYFLVFACLTTVTIIVIYFFFPETKGKSLEELAEIFGDEVIVHLTDATEAERQEIDMKMRKEKAAHEHVEGTA